MAVAPHTSNWDFPTGLWVKLALRLDARFVAKHTLFRWPLGPLLRWLGGIPVDRQAAAGFVGEISRARSRGREDRPGGRARGDAQADGEVEVRLLPHRAWRRVSRSCSLRFDYPRRLVLLGPLFRPTGDYESDLAAMRSHVDARMALQTGELRLRSARPGSPITASSVSSTWAPRSLR